MNPEMRESNYWLKVINGTLTQKNLTQECQVLIKESQELKSILGAICSKTQRK